MASCDQRHLQPVPASTQQSQGDADLPHVLFHVGDVLPARLVAADLMRLFELKKSQFYALVAAGRFDRFELKPQIGTKAWSGARLQAYFEGQLVAVDRKRA